MNESTTTSSEGEPVYVPALKYHEPAQAISQSVVEPDLLTRAAHLNKLSEVSQVALGMCLSIIKDQKVYEPEFSSFDQYYKTELKRSKGDISKLLKVGDFMIRGKFPQETEVPYTLLYQSILSLPDKEPSYILSVAQTNTLGEILDTGRELKHGEHAHEWGRQRYVSCDICGKMVRYEDTTNAN